MADRVGLITYVGRRRIGGTGKLVHMFTRDYNADPMPLIYWEKAKSFPGAVIGCTYDVGESFPTYWPHARVGDNAPVALCTEWQVMDRAEFLTSTAKNIDASPQLSAAIETIAKARARLSLNQRHAFDIWLMDKVKISR